MVYRIDDTTAVSSPPPVPSDNIGQPGFFTGGSTSGQSATRVRFWWLNMIQEELMGIVLASGIVPKKTDNSQVLSALQLLFSGSAAQIPVGVPQPWPIATPPTGWLVCNGAAFSAEQYPSLGAVYGGTLPDLRGVFIRGLDGGRGLDSGRTLLSYQEDAIQSMGGKISFTATTGADSTVTYADGVFTMSAEYQYGSHNQFASASGSWIQDVIMQASNVARTATETRPKNIAFNYIVRAA